MIQLTMDLNTYIVEGHVKELSVYILLYFV